MNNNNHKGSELNNVKETWEQNEKDLQNRGSDPKEDRSAYEDTASNDLEKLVKQEAAEYDNENKETRVLGGERASVNDERTDNT